MNMPLWAAIPATILLVAGGSLALVGALGLLRMKTFYDRMHPPTMATTLGSGCILVASMMVHTVLQDRITIHELMITLFVLITSPISAMTLMRAALRRMRPDHGRDAG